MVLDKLWFRGQVRSLTGPFRGEGAFVSGGEIYGYGSAAGRFGDDGIKVKLNIDIAERPLAIEADGLLAVRSHGAAASTAVSRCRARRVRSRRAARRCVNEPWRLTGKVKANAQSALLEQVEFQYGPEQRAAKLDGAAEIKFGERPRLQGALVGAPDRSRPADRHLRRAAPPAGSRRRRRSAELFGGMMRPSIPSASR